MHTKPPDYNVPAINKGQGTRYRSITTQQKRPNPKRHKAINIKASSPINLSKIKKPAVKENIFKIKITIETKAAIIIIKNPSVVEKET